MYAKDLLISVGDKYAGSPIIEYLYCKMQDAKTWLSIADTYFVYINEDITISVYKVTDNMFTVTPYEKPMDCFISIKAVIGDGAEGVFIVDRPSSEIKAYVETLKSMWEDCNEQ